VTPMKISSLAPWDSIVVWSEALRIEARIWAAGLVACSPD
jgi:hypothetical protein